MLCATDHVLFGTEIYHAYGTRHFQPKWRMPF